jgi:hypothetical protein
VSIGAKEAAELVGMSKNAIFKAIRTGKLSAEKDLNGEWKIEPAELFRVYQPVGNGSRTAPPPSSHLDTAQAIEGLQRENELLRDVVADLRARLDAESEERRKLTNILNEVRAVPTAPAPQPRSWWARLLGG